jgi:putative FmdB family regulatory protein
METKIITWRYKMPWYTYYCEDCLEKFEDSVTIADAEEGTPPCPECLSKNTRRYIEGTALKGVH